MPGFIENWLYIKPGILPRRNVVAAMSAAADRPRDERKTCAHLPLGPNCNWNEGNFRHSLAAAGMTSPERQDILLLIIKVGLSLVAYGEATDEAVKAMTRLSVLHEVKAFGVHFTNLTTMHMHFINEANYHNNIVICCASGGNPGKVSACASIVRAAVGRRGAAGSVSETLNLLDFLILAACPYGRLWRLLAEWLVIAGVSVAIFPGTLRDMYTVMVLNTISMLFQRLKRGNEVLDHLEPLIISFFAGAGASIDQYMIRDEVSRCGATAIMMSVIFNYLPGAGIIKGIREISLGNITLGTGRLMKACVDCVVLAMAVAVGWQVQGFNSLESYEGHSIKDTAAASLQPTQWCEHGHFEDWEVQYFWISIPYYLVFLVYLRVDARDLPFIWPSVWGIWCLYGWLAHNEPAIPYFMEEGLVMMLMMITGGVEELRGGMSRVVGRICLVQSFAPAGTAINLIVSGLSGLHPSGESSDLVGHLLLVGAAFAFADIIAQIIFHPIMHWKRQHSKKTEAEFTWLNKLANVWMVDQDNAAERALAVPTPTPVGPGAESGADPKSPAGNDIEAAPAGNDIEAVQLRRANADLSKRLQNAEEMIANLAVKVESLMAPASGKPVKQADVVPETTEL